MITLLHLPEKTERVGSYLTYYVGPILTARLVFLWKIEDSLFEGWGEDGWKPEDLSPTAKLNAGGRCVHSISLAI
jgi:hypothetical protein